MCSSDLVNDYFLKMEQINLYSYILAIDTKDVNEIENLNNSIIITNKDDIILEMYDNKLLTLNVLNL